MTSIRLSAPGKTFLIGEYAALHQGPAILVCTEPRFVLTAQKNLPPQRLGLSLAGPVAELLKDPFFDAWSLTFEDPHHGGGGFGASSAQYLLLYALKKVAMGETLRETELLEDFQGHAHTRNSIPPSGYDLLAQMMGMVDYIERGRDTLESLAWPFIDLDFVLVRTGQKTATHEHLAKLERRNFRDLENWVRDAREAMRERNSQAFIRSLHLFRVGLEAEGLVAEHTLRLIEEVRHIPGVLSVKGCGALGADVLAVMIRPEDLEVMKERLQPLEIVATSRNLAPGLVVEWPEGPMTAGISL